MSRNENRQCTDKNFNEIKRQSAEDPILQAMLKAREAELQLKNTHVKSDGTEATVNSDNNNI